MYECIFDYVVLKQQAEKHEVLFCSITLLHNSIYFHKGEPLSYNSQPSHFSCEQTHSFQQDYSGGSEFAQLYLLTQLSSHLISYDNAKVIFSMVNMFYHTYLQSNFSPPQL